MSILRVDEIRDNGSGFNDVVTFANSGGTENGKLCRAWVNFNGTSTVAIRANFNVNSITDNGTGDYTVNFSNAMSDANYAITGTGGNGTNLGTVFMCPRGSDPTTSAVRIFAINAGDSFQDTAFNSIVIFR
jgi:hypothetical protein